MNAGLDMAVEQLLDAETVWHCDNDPAATALLAHHYPGTPNLGDITTVDWHRVAVEQPIDVLTGGFPCTDVSAAGRRAGLTPTSQSGLWTHMARAIAVLQPRLVVVENVRGILSSPAHRDVEPDEETLGDGPDEPVLRALGAVLGDLSELGFDARWCGLRAADVGAPHARFRVFIVAWPAADAERFGRSGRRISTGTSSRSPTQVDGLGEGMAFADTESLGRETRRVAVGDTAQQSESFGDRVSDWGQYSLAIDQWRRVLGRDAPAPTVPGRGGNGVLNPAFAEWVMGLDAGHVTGVDGLPRTAQLRLLGNGVVPQQAHAAVTWLLGDEGE